jgi:transposase
MAGPRLRYRRVSRSDSDVKKDRTKKRRAMVRAVRQGMAQREAARRYGVTLRTVQRWVERAEGQRLDRVDWGDRSHRPAQTTRVARELEDRVLAIRRRLRDESILGHYGADAIFDELRRLGAEPLPSRATIVRIVRRRGALEIRKRVRRPAPPRGWYLPAVARRAAELDSFDFIEGLKIRAGPRFDVLTGISLHGGLPAAFPAPRRNTLTTCDALVRHWRRWGLPAYAQFDNDTVFQGAHQFADTVGRVSRLCLGLGVAVVFAPPREHGPQNVIEGFNALWQAKVWRRFEWRTLTELRRGSDRYLTAARRHRASRIAKAPPRRPFPDRWTFDVDAPLHGSLVYLRRLDDRGQAHLLGHRFPVAPDWAQHLVRAEVRLDTQRIVFFGLTRRHPSRHPRLKTVRYELVQKPFLG